VITFMNTGIDTYMLNYTLASYIRVAF
jgi:hypothetical protein